MKDDDNGSRARAGDGRDSIKDLVMQEAAAAIMAAGRELTGGEKLSVRDFLRGPALKVGLALSVMGVTMWVAQMNHEHQARKARRASAGSAQSRQRRARGSADAN
jgi:hypothetical protein